MTIHLFEHTAIRQAEVSELAAYRLRKLVKKKNKSKHFVHLV